MEYVFEKKFESVNFTLKPLAETEYENCSFVRCDFSNSDISRVRFLACEFIECNLSLAKLAETSFQDVKFNNCKMLGLHFDDCDEFCFAVRFENCILNHCVFFKLKLKKTIFRNCSLHEADFVESDLESAVFDNCDLMGAMFDNTMLEKADLRTSFNFSIDPTKNKVKKALFSLQGATGLLSIFDVRIEM
ncbi:pentapeptide repeat-containing protein [Paludibacter sp. 221]|uniref:pentapeptide repeat-containing protein n=1 Tax=Paludibacter sp. 221 TaxID=2302939 RepID=UPI0013D7BE68|nr:pentapeptide repeat-containing protein [Paludibacter sp. 221]NDV46473.1 pentapeptide repeat-containing protein [Paludibacter sp. 221]